MYFVVNLNESSVVAECPSYVIANCMLMDEVSASDGFYTIDDFTILDEEGLEEFGLTGCY